MTGVLIKRGNLDTETEKQHEDNVKRKMWGECHVKMKAEIGVMHL